PQHKERVYLEFMSNPDPTTAAKLLAASSRSQNAQCIAHWIIGNVFLGKGDRDSARKHFEACTATTWYFLACSGCRVYVERMKKDPTWPPWIQLKKEKPKQ